MNICLIRRIKYLINKINYNFLKIIRFLFKLFIFFYIFIKVSRTMGDAEAKLPKYGGIKNVISAEPEIVSF
jgi:hypothetical protein